MQLLMKKLCRKEREKWLWMKQLPDAYNRPSLWCKWALPLCWTWCHGMNAMLHIPLYCESSNCRMHGSEEMEYRMWTVGMKGVTKEIEALYRWNRERYEREEDCKAQNAAQHWQAEKRFFNSVDDKRGNELREEHVQNKVHRPTAVKMIQKMRKLLIENWSNQGTRPSNESKNPLQNQLCRNA